MLERSNESTGRGELKRRLQAPGIFLHTIWVQSCHISQPLLSPKGENNLLSTDDSCLAVTPLEQKWFNLCWCWRPRKEETTSYNQILQTHLTYCHIHGIEDISIRLSPKLISHPGPRHPVVQVCWWTYSIFSTCLMHAKGNKSCTKHSTQGHTNTKTWLMEEKKEENNVMHWSIWSRENQEPQGFTDVSDIKMKHPLSCFISVSWNSYSIRDNKMVHFPCCLRKFLGGKIPAPVSPKY